jgi:hypothetical protein
VPRAEVILEAKALIGARIQRSFASIEAQEKRKAHKKRHEELLVEKEQKVKKKKLDEMKKPHEWNSELEERDRVIAKLQDEIEDEVDFWMYIGVSVLVRHGQLLPVGSCCSCCPTPPQ